MAKPRSGLFSGKKFSNNHTTIIEHAGPVLAEAKKLSEIRRVVLGRIESAHSSGRSLKFKPIPAGLKMIVRGPNSLQEFFLYSANPEYVQNRLLAFWNQHIR